jgi:hypothetical protein
MAPDPFRYMTIEDQARESEANRFKLALNIIEIGDLSH